MVVCCFIPGNVGTAVRAVDGDTGYNLFAPLQHKRVLVQYIPVRAVVDSNFILASVDARGVLTWNKFNLLANLAPGQQFDLQIGHIGFNYNLSLLCIENKHDSKVRHCKHPQQQRQANQSLPDPARSPGAAGLQFQLG